MVKKGLQQRSYMKMIILCEQKKSKCDRYKSSLSIDDRVQAEREQDNSTWKWLHVVFYEKESVLGATLKSNL